MMETNTTLLNTSIKSDFTALLEKNMPAIFPALSMCVLYQGEIVLNQSWGWIDPDQKKRPTTSSALFDLASVTKLFIETTFLTFVSSGKIRLGSKLVDVIPEFGRINPRSIGGGQDPHTRIDLPVEAQFGSCLAKDENDKSSGAMCPVMKNKFLCDQDKNCGWVLKSLNEKE